MTLRTLRRAHNTKKNEKHLHNSKNYCNFAADFIEKADKMVCFCMEKADKIVCFCMEKADEIYVIV